MLKLNKSEMLKSHFSIVYKKVFGFHPDMHIKWTDDIIVKRTNSLLGWLSSKEEKKLLGNFR